MLNNLEQGTILSDRYVIHSYISKGDMGAVYRGFDNRLKCKVAIKQNLLENDLSKQYSKEKLNCLLT